MIARHLRGATGVLLLRINTAFPLLPHALYFLYKVWCPFERMPCQNVSSSNRVQPSAYLCCACGHYLTAAAQMFSPQALCWVPAKKTPPISYHQGGCRHCPWPQQRHVLWLFWEDYCSSCSVHVTCLEGRRAGRWSGPQVCFQNQLTV